jgi:protein tyrosine/serine phosphatase
MSRNRVVALQGVHNFRDYGGYRASDGCEIRSGLLWRSGQHVDATDADLEIIDGIGLRTVIDLRGNSERQMYPCRRGPGFSAALLYVDVETAGDGGQAPHIEAAREVPSVEAAHQRMVEAYRMMPFRPNLNIIFTRYFKALAEQDEPSLLHCLAGKDRTGLAVALLHDLLGVHSDDIMTDYLLTNEAGNIDRRIAAGAATIRRNFGASISDAAIRTLMSVHPEYLNTAFAAIRDQYGTVSSYAANLLDVTPQKLAQIRANILEAD